MILSRNLSRILETAMFFMRRRNIDYTMTVHVVGKVEGAECVPVPDVGVFVFRTNPIPRDGSPQPVPFVGESRSDGSIDFEFQYTWGKTLGWWRNKNHQDTTFALHFVHDELDIEVIPVTIGGAAEQVVSNANITLRRLTEAEAMKIQKRGSRSQYLRKRDPEPGDPGESWDPDSPWPHEAPFGGDTFTIDGNCGDQTQRIVEGVRWAYWQLRNGTIVTDPGLRVCIMQHMNNASISCGGGDCGANTNAYNNDYFLFRSSNIVMCMDNVRKLSPTDVGRLAIHEWAHSCGWDHGDGKGVPGDSGVGLATFASGNPTRVAFNPQDKWVVTMGGRILVIVNGGGVFGHDIAGNTIGPAFQLAGPPVAFNPQDKWVVTMGNRVLVIVNGGGVFKHDFAGNTIGPATQLTGPPVAFNPQDKWVVTMGNRILVIVNNGAVFGHVLTGNTIGPAIQLTGPPVAFRPQDRWVVTMGNRILVIVNTGAVFAHDITGNTIGPAFQITGPRVAFNPQDKWVVTMDNRILVIINSGLVFAHDITGNMISSVFQLS
jgi:hypothetical protein